MEVEVDVEVEVEVLLLAGTDTDSSGGEPAAPPESAGSELGVAVGVGVPPASA